MKNYIEKGTEVLIFKYVDISEIKKNYNNFVIGNVVDYKDESDSMDQELYEVLGEDGKLYYANHKYPNPDIPYYVRTKQEHIISLCDYISTNAAIINNLNHVNKAMQNIVDSLSQEEEKHKSR